MTEQGKPLSRRELRAAQARAAENAPDATESLATVGDDPNPPTGGLSRRDRRRIERSQQPMEVWTAEEEMIATGQLPAMTPDRIAEQERIAKEKAAEAAADAAAAAAELGIAPHEAAPEQAVDPTPPVRESAFARVAVAGAAPLQESEDAFDASDATAEGAGESSITDDAAPAEAAPVETAHVEAADADSSDADHVDAGHVNSEDVNSEDANTGQPDENADASVEAEPEAEAADAPAPHPFAPVSEPEADADAEQHAGALESEPEADFTAPEPVQAEPASEDLANEVVSSPGPEQPEFDDGIPEAFRGMFPPGSLQAQAMAARRRERDADQADEIADPVKPVTQSDEAAPNTGGEAQSDAAEEIRRLTAQAMAGIEGASSRLRAAELAASTDSESVNDSVSYGRRATDVDGGLDADDVATEQTPWRTTDADDAEALSDVAPAPEELAVRPAEEPSELPINRYDEQPGDPYRDLQTEPKVEAGAAVASVDHPTAAPSIWDSHPLTAADVQARELDDAPSQAIPRPDFSQLAPATNPEHPAPFSPTAYSTTPLDGEAPLTTGTIEVARRKVPELHPAGGARHFRWAHIAVIGAIAFVLGVLVWNLAGQGS